MRSFGKNCSKREKDLEWKKLIEKTETQDLLQEMMQQMHTILKSLLERTQLQMKRLFEALELISVKEIAEGALLTIAEDFSEIDCNYLDQQTTCIAFE